MSDRPIIMSATSMRGLLAEPPRKFQTRRVFDPQPYPLEGRPGYWNASGCVGGRIVISDNELLRLHRRPLVGDRLWTREAWRVAAAFNNVKPRDLPHGIAIQFNEMSDRTGYIYEPGRLRAAMHLPRWASRVTLTVSAVRVERLQDISEADARAEGIERDGNCWKRGKIHGDQNLVTITAFAHVAYRSLWESLHGPGSWAKNPFVSVICWDAVELVARSIESQPVDNRRTLK